MQFTAQPVAPMTIQQVQQPKVIQPAGAAAMFNAIDSNHDGKISRSEFAKAFGGQQTVVGPPMQFTAQPVAPVTIQQIQQPKVVQIEQPQVVQPITIQQPMIQ